MKTIMCMAVVVLSGIFVSVANGQDKKAGSSNAELTIKTSAICDMCKNKIEKAVSALDGVSKAELDVKTKNLTVAYDNAKISPEKIREAVSKAGYDADDVKADPTAYAALPACCKKPK